jgi:hypothetical protein
VRQVTDRFRMRRALQGTLPGSLPIGDSLRRLTRLGVVLRQEFRLRGAVLGKLPFQHRQKGGKRKIVSMSIRLLIHKFHRNYTVFF